MEENLRLDFPLSSPDRGGLADCADSSTMTTSASSSVTVDSSDVFLHRNAIAGLDLITEWTDEKHNLFLESLEASFVKHLHHSMALRGGCLRGNIRGSYSSLHLSARTYGCSDQNGYCQEINLKRKEILSDSLEEILPSSEETGISGKLSGSERSLESHSEHMLCHQEAATGSITEFSDQNFMDEGRKNNSNHLFEAKRRKRLNADASSNDQGTSNGESDSLKVTWTLNERQPSRPTKRKEILRPPPAN